MKFNALLTFVILICFNSALLSQLGIGLQHSISHYSSVDDIYTYREYTAYTDYKVGLKNTRLNFYPGLLYSVNDYYNFGEIAHAIGVRLVAQAYIFQMKKDCDCPTIDKSNNYFAQNFFIMLSSSIYSVAHEFDGAAAFKYYEFYVGGGLGIDIPLNKQLKLSPMVHFQPFNRKYGVTGYGETVMNNRFSIAIRAGIKL